MDQPINRINEKVFFEFYGRVSLERDLLVVDKLQLQQAIAKHDAAKEEQDKIPTKPSID